jgi:glutaredoxin
MRALKTFALLLLVPACFAVGLFAGPKLAALQRAWFPAPQYTTGDHRELFAKSGKPVVMYATSTCPYCAKVRKLFAAKGIAYTEYLIDTSEAANAEFAARGGRGVPLLYIGDRRIEGYREEAILDAVSAVTR